MTRAAALAAWLAVVAVVAGTALSILPAIGQIPGVRLPSDRLGEIQALDPAQRGMRHPRYTGFVGPHDRVLSSAVPAFAALRHDSYDVTMFRDRGDAAMAWVQLEVPPEVMAATDDVTATVACNMVHLIALQPHLAGFLRFRVVMVADHDGPASPRAYSLERAACAG